MTIIPMQQAQSSLVQLVQRAASGEIIFIGENDQAEAALTSAAQAACIKPRKRLGLLKGKLRIPDDFDAPLPPEYIAAFEGREE